MLTDPLLLAGPGAGASSSTSAEPTEEIGFVLALSRALHRYGTPAHRLEDAIEVVCDRLGLSCEVFSTPTTIILSFGAPAELRTRMMRVESSELNMGKLEAVDAVAGQVARLELTPARGRAELAAITAAAPAYSARAVTLAQAVSSGAMAVFFGGGPADVMVAAAIGLVLGLLARWANRLRPPVAAARPGPGAPRRARPSRRMAAQDGGPPPGEPHPLARVFELIAAMIAALAASLAATQWHSLSASLVTVAALVVLLPGLSLTVAMTELATGSLISGTARLLAAVIVLLELGVGVAIGERLAAQLVMIPRQLSAPLPEWTVWISLLAAALGVSVLLQSRWRTVGWIVLACLAGTLGSRVGAHWLGHDLGTLFGAFALGVSANVYARALDRPSQAVLVPAAILLVPGSIGFRGMSSLLERNTLSGVDAMFAMFVVATVIVGGLLLANSVVSPRRAL
ncbi:MAG: threonine/serine exporter family protein [Myxococcales bacterium]|nr:threonine/serine exporter family protein [Myxococcales bacterium]